MTHPHSLRIAYNDPQFGALAIAGVVDLRPELLARTWSRLSPAEGSRWVVSMFDEHAHVLESKSVDSAGIRALLGNRMQACVALARSAGLRATA